MSGDEIFGEGQYPREIADYPKAVTFQIIRCQIALSTARTVSEVDMAEQYVDVFQSMIITSADDEQLDKYKKDLKDIFDSQDKELAKLSPKGVDDNAKRVRWLKALQKWTLLLKLASSLGFTVMKKRVVDIP